MLKEKDIEKIRSDFPMMSASRKNQPYIYFDSGATTHKPKCVIDTLADFYLNKYATVHRGIYDLSMRSTDLYNATRKALKDFLHADSEDEIIITKGTTDSINLAAYSFGETFIQEGDEIIISELEHHSNMIPWQVLCKKKKAKLLYIPIDDKAELILEEYKKLLSDKTKLVSVAHMANSTGTIHPIKEIIKLAHEYGAKVLIDGAQSAAHLKVDVQDLDCDFYAFSGHKAFGPNGVGVLYAKRALLEQMVPYQTGGAMIDVVTPDMSLYQPLPLKFEAGTPAFAEVIAWKEALQYIENLGRDNIYAYEKKLLDYATKKLVEIKEVNFIGTAKEKGPVISFVIPGVNGNDIGKFLDSHNIAVRSGHHCAQLAMQRFCISGTVRMSFAVYNTMEEIDRFIQVLKEGIIRKWEI